MEIIKVGKKAAIKKDGAVPIVDFFVMTASGEHMCTKICQDMAEAEEFFAEREANTMPTNGYELHTAADL